MKITAIVFTALLLSGIFLPGCSQDSVLSAYNTVVETVGNFGLTSSLTLKGERAFGADDYTGTYKADYVNFTGEEYLFGGTTLEHREEEAVTVTCTLTGSSGRAVLLWNCGSNTAVTLLEADGDCSETVYLAPGSNYFNIECENFTGSIDLTIE